MQLWDIVFEMFQLPRCSPLNIMVGRLLCRTLTLASGVKQLFRSTEIALTEVLGTRS